jgi:hypothetical protein
MQRALDKARSATNSFIDTQALKFSGGTDTGPLHDPHVGTAGHLGMGQLESLWTGAGGPSDVAHLMAAIAMAESGGIPSRNNADRPGDGGHHIAAGLWQILGLPFRFRTWTPVALWHELRDLGARTVMEPCYDREPEV